MSFRIEALRIDNIHGCENRAVLSNTDMPIIISTLVSNICSIQKPCERVVVYG